MSSEKILTNCKICTGETILTDHAILIKDGETSGVIPSDKIPDSRETTDLNGNLVLPGFIDLQLNGGAGAFFTRDTSEEALDKIYKVYLKSGTTAFLPTIISTSLERILLAIEVTRSYMKKNPQSVLGLHVEGPFFNIKKKGAHAEKFIRAAVDEEIKIIAEQGKGVVSLLTAAPEIISEKQVKILLDAGIRLSAGHSGITYQEAMKAFGYGFSKVTHLFNAMSPFASRDPGLVGAFLDHAPVWGGIIVDGIHVSYAAVRLAHRLKKGKLIAVTDSSYVDHPASEKAFDFGFGKIINSDGKFVTENGSLAGASLTMLESLQNCVRHVGIDVEEAAKMHSTYPAQYLGLDNEMGKIRKGYAADLVVLNEKLEAVKIFKAGEELTNL